MHRRIVATLLPLAAVAIGLSGCGGSQSSAGTALSCSTYNTVTTNPQQGFDNTKAVSALLVAHGINPAGNHHYDSAAGSCMMNVSVASTEIDRYCASNPNSSIDQGISWSNFTKR